ncbi:MAG: transglutaminase [Comamonadaceae bacterium CG_4_9_14_3_um_filter_60_33]|nr:MAG: transglutaminase [Comamonadaceae bacterium CG_4_10_14_3_um_filter_60_42]PJB44414.1 MAG: transglutaminase [Comamonadaceae bacterium CG_4_9_14_3_um_filter_60_33]
MTVIPAQLIGTSRPCDLCRNAGLSFLGLTLLVAATFAAPDLDKTQALAQQRYGARAAETVAAWRQLMEESRALTDQDKLTKVNTFFNRRMLFVDDIIVWRQKDYWATPLEFIGRGAGDCEDFTIAKYMTLQMLGIGNEHLRLIYIRAKSGSRASFAHMVLGYYPQPTDEPLILDNLISSVRPASQRPDLVPVFSFNNDGLWVGGAATSAADPTVRLSRWRNVLERMRQDGL